MAPIPTTEDYYKVLGVTQSAGPESIVSAYRRLARTLHPDRNKKHDATAAFQLLGQAYETLGDVTKRREYDLIYPSIIGRSFASQTGKPPRPPSASTPQSGTPSEAAQLAAIQKSKQERSTRWWTTANAFYASIARLEKDVRRIEQEIEALNSISAAEAAADAQKNSWATWLLSPLYKKVEETEDVKARKDRERQERRLEKDMKERRLELKKTELRMEENRLRKAKEDVDAGDWRDNEKFRDIQAKIWARESRERQEREKAETERIKEILRQQREQREDQQRQAAEAIRKRQAQERAADEERRRESFKKWNNEPSHYNSARGGAHQAGTSSCCHPGWWLKVQGRTACPKCSDFWTYLLQCPGCAIQACPKCQAAMRPRYSGNTSTTNRGRFSRVRTPNPAFTYDWDI